MTETVSSPAWTTTATGRRARDVLAEVERAVVGKRAALELVLLGILSGGHVLLEDLPGLGKTLMARTIARAHGGEVELESSPGRGATFRLVLPAASAAR